MVGEAFELEVVAAVESNCNSLDYHWGVLLLAGLLLLLDYLLDHHFRWVHCRLDCLGHLLLTQCSRCWILKADLGFAPNGVHLSG